MSLRGVIPPLVTPFQADGALDLASFEANLESLSAYDLAGFLVLGSNGEAASLEEEEKLALVAAARRGVASGRLLLVGTGMESTRATIALARRVADLGADAVLVLTPHYYKSRMTAGRAAPPLRGGGRRRRRCRSTSTRCPRSRGSPGRPGSPAALAAHPRIAGMKESSGDVGLLSRIVASVPRSFRVACGNAPVFYPALCAGAAAGVLAVANCAPRPAIALLRAFEAGDHARARRIQEALAPLAAAVTTVHGVAGLKEAMSMVGLRGGSVRAPLLPAPASVRDEIRPLLEAAEAAAA